MRRITDSRLKVRVEVPAATIVGDVLTIEHEVHDGAMWRSIWVQAQVLATHRKAPRRRGEKWRPEVTWADVEIKSRTAGPDLPA
jgi:hypothetical protein